MDQSARVLVSQIVRRHVSAKLYFPVFPVRTAQTAALAIQMKKYRNYGRIIISTFLAISKIIRVEYSGSKVHAVLRLASLV